MSGFAGRRLCGILAATWLAQAVYVATKLNVPDLLAGGPRDTADLAAACDADASALRRVLRTLAAAGVLRAEGSDSFGLATVGELLRTDAPGGGRDMVLMQGAEVFRSFAEIEYTVRTGQPAFDKVYERPFYAYLAENPQAAAVFHGPMAERPPAALSTVDLSDARTLVDLGGGTGSLLTELLDAYQELRGVLVELPAAADAARQRLARFGTRASVVSGNVFTDVPTGADVYVLSRVLHNWPDAECVDLLRLVHSAAAPGARCLVLERLLEPCGPSGLAAHLGDLLMLVTLPGRDRTGHEYRELLTTAGFAVARIRSGDGPNAESIIEAVKR